MKKLILLPLVLIVALGFSSFSGGKCKFDVDKVDKFTGERTRSIYFPLNEDKQIVFNCIGKQFSIAYNIALEGQMRDNLTLADTLYIILQNGKRIKLGPNEEVKPIVKASQIIFSTYSPVYNLSRKKMQLLSMSPITDIRVMIANKPIDAEVKEFWHERVMDMVKCLLEDDEAETK